MSHLDEHSTQDDQIAGVAARLRLDAASAQVLELLAGMGVPAALLKGASLIGWLYETNVTPYTDVDILVSPAGEQRAADALTSLGFKPVLDDATMPDWWREHASEWQRAQDGVSIDLHRRLVGIGLPPQAAWEILAEHVETMPIGGYEAPVLGPSARLVHVTLHAAQHGSGGGGKGRFHLERALARFPAEDWATAAELAARLDATDAFVAGLRLLPEGRALADELGLLTVGSVDAALRATTPPPVALGFEQLAQAHGLRARVTIALHKLFPPREFLLHWDPRAGESRARLLAARIRRPMWVLRGAPRGFRAWWRARRAVRGSP